MKKMIVAWLFLYLMAAISYMLYLFIWNPEYSNQTKDFYKKYPNLINIKNELTSDFPVIPRIKISNGAKITALNAKMLDLGVLKVCNVEFNEESPFFNSVAFPDIKMSLKYEMIYAHELSHCLDEFDVVDQYYSFKNGYESAVIEIGAWGLSAPVPTFKQKWDNRTAWHKEKVLQSEVFADAFSTMYFLSKSKDLGEYTKKRYIVDTFIKYRRDYGYGSHDTSKYIENLLYGKRYDFFNNLSPKEIKKIAVSVRDMVIINN